jgi:hypothetical protein
MKQTAGSFGVLFILLSLLNQASLLGQLSMQQGISSIGIRPSASLLTFGLPQSASLSNGFSNGVMSYLPFPNTSLPLNTSMNQEGKTSFYGLVGSFDLGINYSKLLPNNRIFKLEGGVYYACIPQAFSIANDYTFTINGKEGGIWQEYLSYSGYSGSVMYTSKSRGRRGLGEVRNYLEVGLRTMNFVSKSTENSDTWIFNGKGFSYTSEITNRKSNMLLIEFGKLFWRPADDMRSLSFGVRVGISLNDMVKSTYQGAANGQISGGNSVLENGSYIGFQTSYNLPIKQLTKSTRNRHKKAAPIFCEMERKVEVTHHIKVPQGTLQIEVFDHEHEDGDIVSLCYNGSYLLEKYTLSNKPKVLELSIVNFQANLLTVYANNTGSEGANTSAIRFRIRGKEQTIILYADRKSSEAISFEVE